MVIGGNAARSASLSSGTRQRLNAIARPITGGPSITGVSWRWGLTHVVRILANAVDIRVGMRTRPIGMKSPGADSTGFYIEVGSRTAPAQPYLRPAVFQNAREIVRLLAGRV